MVKQNLTIEKAQVIEVMDTFFTAMVEKVSGKKFIEEFDFEEVSEQYHDKIVPDATFEIQHYRELRTNGSKIICMEIIFP